MLIDCHIHTTKRWITSEELQRQLQAARDNGIGRWISLGVNLEDSAETIETANSYDDLFAGMGVHPMSAATANEETYRQLGDLASANRKVVCIGEIGLDYAEYKDVPPEVQRDVFRKQIRLAKELRLPINAHVARATAQDLLSILKEEKAAEVGGVIHNFGGNEQMARQLTDMGFYCSVGVLIMHPEADRLRGARRGD